MTAKLTASLREAPATVPALAAIALFIVWAADQAGYPVTHWAPGGLVVLALLGLTVVIVGSGWSQAPRTVRVAVAALAAFTLLSFLSILWAGVTGDAWEGANRTLLYLLVFALFASHRQGAASAALLLGGWTLAMIALAAFALLHVDSAGAGSLGTLAPEGRLVYPSGYANANAAQWLMAFWPAVLLARTRQLPWGLRGVLAGGAVLLAEVALLSQSRGSLYATPVMLVLVFALVPNRTRTFALLVPVAAGVLAAAPAVLRVGDHLGPADTPLPAHLHAATLAVLAAALAVGLTVAAGAALDAGPRLSRRSRLALRRGVAALALAALVAAVAGGLAVAGDPVTRLESAWHSFKGGYGEDSHTGSRLTSGLGSNRYDFYRVALDEFAAHPLLGIGADNFQDEYLIHGRSGETPHYPHSVELRTLSQTGLAGGAIAIVGLGAALLAAAAALRAGDPLARSVAAGGLACFGYWVVHGSFDWFWEFAGLGAPAFALLGLACALAPPRAHARPPGGDGASPVAPGSRREGRARRSPAAVAGVAAAALAALAAAASLAAPWLSQLELQSAARVWTTAPQTAYARLRDAAALNPLSDQAYLLAGSIAVRYGELDRAAHQFSLALERDPHDAYATLQLGAIASTRGEPVAAVRLLARALSLNPREALVRQALATARSGHRVDVQELDRSILTKAQQLA
jgi:Flp pilus assembly protein TadD